MSYEYDESTYKDDLFIDKFNLDLEWLKQAMLFVKWAERWAQAVERRDRAKQLLEVVKAEIYSKIRADPQVYKLPSKPTESTINSYIITTKKHKEAFDSLIERNREVNILASAKEAMNHKRKALEYVTQLMLGGFYANPSIDGKARKMVEDHKSAMVREHIKDSDGMQERTQNLESKQGSE